MRKKRILVAPGVGAGHVMPHLAVAHALAALGHDVTFYSEAWTRSLVREAGLDFVQMPLKGEAEGFRKKTTTKQISDQYLKLARRIAPHVVQVLADRRIELAVTDALSLGPSLAVERAGCAWASLATSPSTLATNMDETAQAMIPTAALRRSLGLPPTSENSYRQGLSRSLVLLPWTPEFDLGPRPRQGVHVGPLAWHSARAARPPAWLKRLDKNRPWILAGVTTNPFDVLKDQVSHYVSEVIAALNELPVQAVLTLGDEHYTIRAAPGPNVKAVPFVAHAHLMPHVTATITHGGWGTICHSMIEGVPMVVVPNILDQPLNARLVESAGLGFNIPLDAVTAEVIYDRVLRLLRDDSPVRVAAARMGERIRKLQPARSAAKAILAAF